MQGYNTNITQTFTLLNHNLQSPSFFFVDQQGQVKEGIEKYYDEDPT